LALAELVELPIIVEMLLEQTEVILHFHHLHQLVVGVVLLLPALAEDLVVVLHTHQELVEVE
jgi:hypothetical protein